MFCSVLSCPPMFCRVMFCLLLSCPFMFCLVLSCPVMFCHVLSCSVLSTGYGPVVFFGKSGSVVFFRRYGFVVFLEGTSPLSFLEGVVGPLSFFQVKARCLFWKVWTRYHFGKSGPVVVLESPGPLSFWKVRTHCLMHLLSQQHIPTERSVHERLEHLNLKQILNNLRDVLLFKADLCSLQ
jgi:hypothetical protein